MRQLELFGNSASDTASQTLPSGKTFPEPSPAIKAETLLLSSKRWQTSGRLTLRGESWTAASSESPNAAVECSLSQILEANAPSKYWLSPKACAGILRRAEKRGKELPLALATALEQVAQSPASGPRGGGPAGDEHYNLIATHVPPKAACLETTNHDYSRADGFTAIPYTLEVRGRDGESVLEHRQDGTANALRTPGGGRGGMGVGAVAYGFYSNEGSHGMGDNANVSPSVKIGSGLGIPSPPAVAFNIFPGRPGENTPATLRAIETDIAHSVTVTEHEKSTDRGTRVVEANRSVVRRLTPVECCRLQGFPDDWNSEGIDKTGKRIQMADAPRYRQLGNAVTVNVANWIANNLAAVYAAPKESADGEP